MREKTSINADKLKLELEGASDFHHVTFNFNFWMVKSRKKEIYKTANVLTKVNDVYNEVRMLGAESHLQSRDLFMML